MPSICTVCRHPQQAAIDRLLASGTESHRSIANQFDLKSGAVQRHFANHLVANVLAAKRSAMQSIERTVRKDERKRLREADDIAEMWLSRLDKTYRHVGTALEVASIGADQGDLEALGMVARLGMTAGSICETGLRSSGVLKGGPEAPPSINVECLIVLPSVQTPAIASPGAQDAQVIDLTPLVEGELT